MSNIDQAQVLPIYICSSLIMPDCLEEIVKALCTGLSVQGQVIVAFDYDADEQSEYERQLADRITTAIST
ncbi:hypothetical protein BTJ68_06695 [Hortaea werneckii EXF-2000]|uniref:Uncharacterized protein n=1 Tax=Hortaea werneckii EXF-2000 TaxID=1157616 RepID=A0A1Z5TF17_HORWE|nr:hypothetical protein BTJ68_06695 [Hortaea werneckii EXF-2000]